MLNYQRVHIIYIMNFNATIMTQMQHRLVKSSDNRLDHKLYILAISRLNIAECPQIH